MACPIVDAENVTFASLDIGGDMRGWTGPRVDGCTRWHFENRRERRGGAERRADERKKRKIGRGGCTLCAQLRNKNVFALKKNESREKL